MLTSQMTPHIALSHSCSFQIHTWKDMEIGGRTQGVFSFVVATKVTSALNECSASPVNFEIFHTCRHIYLQITEQDQHRADSCLTSAFFVASYFAFPIVTRMLALAVLSGTGMRIIIVLP